MARLLQTVAASGIRLQDAGTSISPTRRLTSGYHLAAALRQIGVFKQLLSYFPIGMSETDFFSRNVTNSQMIAIKYSIIFSFSFNSILPHFASISVVYRYNREVCGWLVLG